jgi:hypothetical protein
MLDKNTMCLCGCPRFGGNPCPNARITYQTDISSSKVQIARLNFLTAKMIGQDDCQFESAAIIIPRVANFQSDGSQAILSVCCIQVQTKLVRVNQQSTDGVERRESQPATVASKKVVDG